MTTNLDRSELANEIERQTEFYVQAFNSGDADAVNRMYTDQAVTVWEPEKPLTGQERKDCVAAFLKRRPTMMAKTRHAYVTGDTALLVVDWSIDTTGSDGEQEHFEGVGLDVLRRDRDGNWRYAIDHPYGEDS